MTDYLDLACKYHGVDKGRVIKHRAQIGPSGSDDYSIIVDNGILGCPKYYVPISELDALEIAEPLEGLRPPANEVSYRELQELAKEQGILANQKAEDLRAALWPEVEPFGITLWPSEDEEE
jgi:hypothetical protein